MSRLDKLKEIIRELIKNELDEASTSSATPGYLPILPDIM